MRVLGSAVQRMLLKNSSFALDMQDMRVGVPSAPAGTCLDVVVLRVIYYCAIVSAIVYYAEFAFMINGEYGPTVLSLPLGVSLDIML